MPDAELSNTTPQGVAAASSLHQRPTHPHRARNPARCRFFGTKKGVSRTSLLWVRFLLVGLYSFHLRYCVLIFCSLCPGYHCFDSIQDC
jgi:hypothetical protein